MSNNLLRFLIFAFINLLLNDYVFCSFPLKQASARQLAAKKQEEFNEAIARQAIMAAGRAQEKATLEKLRIDYAQYPQMLSLIDKYLTKLPGQAVPAKPAQPEVKQTPPVAAKTIPVPAKQQIPAPSVPVKQITPPAKAHESKPTVVQNAPISAPLPPTEVIAPKPNKFAVPTRHRGVFQPAVPVENKPVAEPTKTVQPVKTPVKIELPPAKVVEESKSTPIPTKITEPVKPVIPPAKVIEEFKAPKKEEKVEEESEEEEEEEESKEELKGSVILSGQEGVPDIITSATDQSETLGWATNGPIISIKNAPNYVFLGLFDGQGSTYGKQIAQYVADHLSDKILKNRVEFKQIPNAVKRSLFELDEELIKKFPNQIAVNGTTASFVIFTNKKIYMFNIGNSKILRYRKLKNIAGYMMDNILEIGAQSLESSSEKARFKKYGIEIVGETGDQKFGGDLTASRGLGFLAYSPALHFMPEELINTTHPEGQLTLLNYDLWKTIDNQNVIEIIKKHSADKNFKQAAIELINTAKKINNSNNLAIMIVDLPNLIEKFDIDYPSKPSAVKAPEIKIAEPEPVSIPEAPPISPKAEKAPEASVISDIPEAPPFEAPPFETPLIPVKKVEPKKGQPTKSSQGFSFADMSARFKKEYKGAYHGQEEPFSEEDEKPKKTTPLVPPAKKLTLEEILAERRKLAEKVEQEKTPEPVVEEKETPPVTPPVVIEEKKETPPWIPEEGFIPPPPPLNEEDLFKQPSAKQTPVSRQPVQKLSLTEQLLQKKLRPVAAAKDEKKFEKILTAEQRKQAEAIIAGLKEKYNQEEKRIQNYTAIKHLNEIKSKLNGNHPNTLSKINKIYLLGLYNAPQSILNVLARNIQAHVDSVNKHPGNTVELKKIDDEFEKYSPIIDLVQSFDRLRQNPETYSSKEIISVFNDFIPKLRFFISQLDPNEIYKNGISPEAIIVLQKIYNNLAQLLRTNDPTKINEALNLIRSGIRNVVTMSEISEYEEEPEDIF